MTNEELEQEVKRLEEQITKLRFKILESKAEKKPYEVKVPRDIENYYSTGIYGIVDRLEDFSTPFRENCYIRGLVFKTREEAEQFDKECILINKLKDWAKKYNGDWTHNLKDLDEGKYITRYDYEDNRFAHIYSCYHNDFSKLPIFESEEIAEQFIENFRDEIKEVLC